MNKKGFTLVELLAVLVILSLIAAITIGAVSNGLENYRNNLYNTQVNNIKAAARMWAVDHKDLLPTGTSGTCTYKSTCSNEYLSIIVYLSQLQDEGYIDKNIKNVKNKESFENVKVKITKQANSKEYTYEYISKVYAVYNVGDEVKIRVNSTYSPDFIIIENSTQDDTTVKALLKSNYTTSTWCNDSSCDSPTSVLKSLPNNWDYASSVSILTAQEVANVTLSNGISVLGTEDFWTSTKSNNTSASYTNLSGSVPTQLKNISETGGVRPVITINKQYVED